MYEFMKLAVLFTTCVVVHLNQVYTPVLLKLYVCVYTQGCLSLKDKLYGF